MNGDRNLSDLDLYVAADLDEPVSGATTVNGRVRNLLLTMLALALETGEGAVVERAHIILDQASAALLGSTREIKEYVVWGSQANMPAAQKAFESPYHLPTHVYGYPISHIASYNKDCMITLSMPSASGRTIYVKALLA